MLRNILRKNQFLKKINTLLELYSYSHNTENRPIRSFWL